MAHHCDQPQSLEVAMHEINVVLFSLTDQELGSLDLTDGPIPQAVDVLVDGRRSLLNGSAPVDVERLRRASLTGHQRIIENARRRELRGDLA